MAYYNCAPITCGKKSEIKEKESLKDWKHEDILSPLKVVMHDVDYEYGGGNGPPASNEGVGKTTIENLEGCKVEEGIPPHYGYNEPILMDTWQMSSFRDKINPLNGLSAHPYEMIFSSMGDFFINLATSMLYVRFGLVDETNTAVTAAYTKLKGVDNILNSMWESLEVKLNEVPINNSGSRMHGYRSIMEYNLSIEKNVNSCYTTSGFGQNPVFKNSEYEYCGPIPCDMLRCDNHFAPGHKLSLTFFRSEDKFCLLDEDGKVHKIVIKEIFIKVDRIRLRPEITRKLLSAGPQHYTTAYTEIKDYPLAANQSQWTIKLYAGGVLPHQVIVGMVTTEAFTGTFKTDPFKFEPFGLNHFCLRVNGVRLPQDPLTPDFAQNRYSAAYLSVYENTGKFRVNGGNSITYEDFSTSKCILPTDLSPDKCNNHHYHVGAEGVLDIELAWAAPLTKPITVVVLSIFNQVIQIPDAGAPPNIVIF